MKFSIFNLQFSILLLIVLLGVLMFSPLTSYAQYEYKGLVPCGCVGYDKETGKCCAEIKDGKCIEGVPCQFCHIFVLFKNIIDLLVTKIVPVLAVLMIAIAGFMYVFAYLSPGAEGQPALLSKAKSLLTSVVWGLLIIFGAWLIVNTFFMLIGVADWTGLKEGWWKINCP